MREFRLTGVKWLLSSVAQSCPPLCNPMDCSMPGLPVHYQLPKFTQTHVHWVGDAIQPSHPLSSPSPPAFNLSHHRGLFRWVSSSHQMAIVTIGSSHIGSGRTRTWLHPGVLTSVHYSFYYSIQNYVTIPLAHSTHNVSSGNRFNKVSVFICLGSCNKIPQAGWLK